MPAFFRLLAYEFEILQRTITSVAKGHAEYFPRSEPFTSAMSYWPHLLMKLHAVLQRNMEYASSPIPRPILVIILFDGR